MTIHHGKKHISSHQIRKQLVEKYLHKLRKKYIKLEQFSREARYDKLAVDIKWHHVTKWYNIVDSDFVGLVK